MTRKPRPETAVEAPPQPATVVYLDPNSEPVKVVDQVTLHPINSASISLTLGTLLPVAMSDGSTRNHVTVAARLRLSPEMARLVVQGLTQQLAMLERGDKPSN